MSSNLLKYGYTCVKEEGTRVIDTNQLIAQKLESFTQEGFQGGIMAPRLEEVLPEEEENFLQEEMMEEPQVDWEQVKQQAEEEIRQQKELAAQELELERHKVLEEAKEKGYQEGLEKATLEYQAKEQQLEQKRKQLEADYVEQLKELEPHFIDTLTGIYRHVFRVELEKNRDILLYLAHAVLAKTEGIRHFVVRVSCQDYAYVCQEREKLTSGIGIPTDGVEIVEDSNLEQNQCMVETETGIYDCSVETELAELEQKLKLLSYQDMEKR